MDAQLKVSIISCSAVLVTECPYDDLAAVIYLLNLGALPTRLLAAWGDEVTISYHGTSNVVQGQVTLFGGSENSNADPLVGILADAAVSYFDVTEVSLSLQICVARSGYMFIVVDFESFERPVWGICAGACYRSRYLLAHCKIRQTTPLVDFCVSDGAEIQSVPSTL